MSLKSAVSVFCVLVLAPFAASQAWNDSYNQALKAAGSGDWAAAKVAFQAAIAVRPEDQSTPTMLPGPVTEPNKWKNGSPYSPNFGAAYSAFKLAQGASEPERTADLNEAANGFETLLAKGQVSVPTLYFLNQVYGMQRMAAKQRDLEQKLSELDARAWKVDTSFVPPEEVGAMNAAAPSATTGGGSSGGTGNGGPAVTVIHPGSDSKTTLTTSVAGRVPIVNTKFALLIGNSQSQMADGNIAFASSDMVSLRESLVQNAGYDDRNVDLASNATAEQMMTAAKALADRLPPAEASIDSSKDPTVLVFFSGVGVNVDGKDYFAGVDASMSTDTTKMVSKEDLLSVFRGKGAKVFLFCQANRPIKDGRYFGMEVPLTGRVALCQATSPGKEVTGTMSGGKLTGIYVKAFMDVLAEYRTNQVPISDFCWAVFQSIQGGSGQGGTSQVPSNPTIMHMGEDSSF